MSRSLRVIVALGLALSVAQPAVAGMAPTDDTYVRDVAGRVAGHVEAERWDEALAQLDEAERERPHPVFIYMRATIEERRGDCERAAALYREFLGHDVPEADAEDAREGETRCREALGLPAVGTEDPAGQEEVPPDEGPAAAWHTDPWGGVLVVGGVAGLGAGVGLYVQSRADERAATDAATLQSYEDRSARAVRLNRAGIATMAIGSAVLVAGIVRYAWVAARGRRRVTLAPRLGRTAAGVTMTLRF